MRGSVGIFVLSTDLVPALEENVWVSRALAVYTLLKCQRLRAGCMHLGASRMFCNELSFGLPGTDMSSNQVSHRLAGRGLI